MVGCIEIRGVKLKIGKFRLAEFEYYERRHKNDKNSVYDFWKCLPNLIGKFL